MKVTKQHLFIDFEFTMNQSKGNPNMFRPEIIEVGIVSVIEDEIYDTYSSYVKPVLFPQLTKRCIDFLGIHQKQVDRGISLSHLVDLLDTYLSFGPTKIVTWGNQDMKVLRNNCRYSNIQCPVKDRERDLSKEYQRFFGHKNQSGLWRVLEEYGRKGIGKHHRALDDALTTYEVFKAIEKDKSYMKPSQQPTLGDRVDFSKILSQFA
ncbi:or 3'-5' exonuclease KapD [Alkalihalophilus pseudofirmus]|nr:or 3'-5' exonuclease KapD [Alkalihalophilus pseudofirmus]